MSDTVIPFPSRADAPVSVMPRSDFGLRPPLVSDADKRTIDAALKLAREEGQRIETRVKAHHVQRDFERDMRRKRIAKSEDLDSAARLDALAAGLAKEADIMRLHYRSDAFLSLKEMQSILETEAAKIRAEWEIEI